MILYDQVCNRYTKVTQLCLRILIPNDCRGESTIQLLVKEDVLNPILGGGGGGAIMARTTVNGLAASAG